MPQVLLPAVAEHSNVINVGTGKVLTDIGSVTLALVTMQIEIATIVLLARYDSRQHFAGVVTCLLCK